MDLVQPLHAVMTVPSFNSFMTLMTGWIYARRRTITSVIIAADAVDVKHHSAFHRLFASARWSLDTLGLAVFRLLEPWLDDVVMLALDDTLARKRGLKVFGVGMHHDPILSTRKTAIMNWGHSWVVLAVLVKFPFCTRRVFALPILFRLYLNKGAAEKHRRVYRTRPQLAVHMLKVLCLFYENRRFHVVADSAYGGQSVLNYLPVNCDLTSRLSLDARLYKAPPIRMAGTPGRPRKRGERLSNPQQMLDDRTRRIQLDLYGRHDRVRIADVEARVYAAPDRPLRVVAVEPLTGGRGTQAFYSTMPDAKAEQVLAWYAQRWSLEVTFQEAKQRLGFEQPQGWTRQAVERTAPMAMLLYSLIVLWFAKRGHRLLHRESLPWYRHKPHASFADMLATLRAAGVRRTVLSTGLRGRGSRKVLRTVLHAYRMAA
ncbi:MAG: transposase [Candidatus Latescibacteria bacterium]|nr:transposase [Candidatus Latescibacterota bacterium]